MRYYKAIKINGIKKDYHRLLVQQQAGRELGRNEVVHHKDGNKFNNNLDNLELTSLSEHSREHSRHTLNSARLTVRDIPAIRAIGKMGLSNRQIGWLFGVAKETIRDVLSGKTWSWVNSLF